MGKTAFIFPGQGAQYVGMGQQFFTDTAEGKDIFAAADKILGFSLQDLCLEGPIEDLQKTSNTQPALLAVSYMAYVLLSKEGVKPDLVAGHSLGEYSALLAAGVMDFSTALQLVRKRGELMEEAAADKGGGMAAILGLAAEKLEAVCAEVDGIVEPVNYNCPGQIVIAGEVKALEEAMKKAKEQGAKRAVRLAVSGPFHSSLMQPVGEKLAQELALKEFVPASIPVVTNVDASFLTEIKDIKESLVKQVYSSVRWEQSVRAMLDFGIDTFIELGPGKVLSGLVKKIDKSVNIYHVEDMETLAKTTEALKEGM